MTDGKIQILGIVGSLLKYSYNKGLMRVAQEVAPEGVTIDVFDIGQLPLFNQDLEKDPPAAVLQLKAQIRAADAILFATPEYNYSITGVLKNAIDWASYPFNDNALKHKPAGIMGTGGIYGTARAQLALRQIFVFTETYAMLKPDMIITHAWEKFDAEGNLKDESIRERMGPFLASLVEWTERLRLGAEALQMKK